MQRNLMEVYFSGTIERIIFENPSNFYRILLLEIDDTDAEDFDDLDVYKRQTQDCTAVPALLVYFYLVRRPLKT